MSDTEPCASCPFREDNFEEFNAIAKKLSAKHGEPEPDFFQCLTIRERVKTDAIENGILACHLTVYNEETEVGDYENMRPCQGLEQHLEREMNEE